MKHDHSIIIENLTVILGKERQLFENLNLNISKNSFNILLGSTGSGKTTILRIIKGIIPYLNKINISGNVYINNELKSDKTFFQQSIDIGYLFQDFDLQFIGSTVENELAFQLENMGIPSEEIQERVQWYTERFHLSDIIKKAPQNLSGGELAKVEFISAVITDPSIVLLDEPFANLDYLSKKMVLYILNSFIGQYTILISTHDFIPFIDLVDNIFIVDNNKLLHYSDIKSFFLDIKRFDWINISDLAINYYLKGSTSNDHKTRKY